MDKKIEMTPREAALKLGIRLDNLYALLWANKIQARKQDGRWFVQKDSVNARVTAKIPKRKLCENR